MAIPRYFPILRRSASVTVNRQGFIHTRDSPPFFGNDTAANQFVGYIYHVGGSLPCNHAVGNLECVGKIRVDSARLACELVYSLEEKIFIPPEAFGCVLSL